jgi:hypothetical protein
LPFARWTATVMKPVPFTTFNPPRACWNVTAWELLVASRESA